LIEYTPLSGTTITEACKIALDMSIALDDIVKLSFNDVDLKVNKLHDVSELVTLYDTKRKVRQAKYKK